MQGPARAQAGRVSSIGARRVARLSSCRQAGSGHSRLPHRRCRHHRRRRRRRRRRRGAAAPTCAAAFKLIRVPVRARWTASASASAAAAAAAASAAEPPVRCLACARCGGARGAHAPASHGWPLVRAPICALSQRVTATSSIAASASSRSRGGAAVARLPPEICCGRVLPMYASIRKAQRR
jgi:hypothetical protein